MAKKLTKKDQKKIREVIYTAMKCVYRLYGTSETDQQKAFLDLASEMIYEELNKKEEG